MPFRRQNHRTGEPGPRVGGDGGAALGFPGRGRQWPAEGLTTSERAELAQLRRENRILREERDILKRATAFFAKETR